MSWGYQALVLDPARLIALPHPNEAATLRENGTSFFNSGIRGRYARVDHRICLVCGSSGERARLGFPVTVAGCLIVMALLTALTFAGALARIPGWLLPGLGIGSWLLLTWLATYAVRVLYRSRQKALPSGTTCESCGSTQMRDVASALQSDVCCPACKAKAFRMHAVGVS
jgi:hypothetical protein